MVLDSRVSWVLTVAFSSTEGSLRRAQLVTLSGYGSGQTSVILAGHSIYVAIVAFSLARRYAASGSDDCFIRLWDGHTAKCAGVLEGHRRWVTAIAFSSDCHRIATSLLDDTFRL
jgi:WD40 repeat protein